MATTDYERALQRAHDAGLKVMGKGEWTGSGATFYVVSSASDANLHHLVTVHSGRLTCDCRAGQHGRMCQHRALTHEQIECERRAESAIRQGFADAERIAREKRETAMLASRASNAGFSIWASN